MAYEIIRNDITREEADAIVTLPHHTAKVGPGVDKAIHAKAGPKLLAARRKLGLIEPGDAWTTPAYGLKAKWVIHALGPIKVKDDPNEHQLLQMSYAAILREAVIHGAKSVAIPLVSSGNYSYSSKVALDNAVRAIEKFLTHYSDLSVKLIVFSDAAYDYAREKWPKITRSKIGGEYAREYLRKNPLAKRQLGPDEPSGYYQETGLMANESSFRDLFVRYSDRFMKNEAQRMKNAQKSERKRFRRADRKAGKVDDAGYYRTLAAIAQRAGVDYQYLKNLRTRNCKVKPNQAMVERLAEAIETTPDETRKLLLAASRLAI